MLLNLYISDPRSYEHYRTSSWYKTWKNSGPYLNPWPLRYRCSALPTGLTSQLGARYYFDPKFIKYCILKERARSLLFLWGGGVKPALGRLANFPRSIREICDHLPFFPIIIRPFSTSWCILSWLQIQVSDETFQSRNEGFRRFSVTKNNPSLVTFCPFESPRVFFNSTLSSLHFVGKGRVTK